jgi:hypothetical protein
MTLLSFWGLYRKMGRPYNPVIASGRGAKRRRAPKQTTEITKKLAISDRRFQVTEIFWFSKFGKKRKSKIGC